MLKQFSQDVAALVATASPRLVHIGGPGISGRTGVLWSDGLVVALAREATDGETVTVLSPGGTATATNVVAWDARSGVVLLKAPGLTAGPWAHGAPPAVGSMAVTVAFASPHGVEARLDLVRFTGQGHFQTDGGAFPGFSGAAVLDPEGKLLGLVTENRHGNGGLVTTVAELAGLVVQLQTSGSRRKAYLGVNTRPAGTEQGLSLTEIEADGPAAKAGLQAGDLLLSLAGETVAHPLQLVNVLASLAAGQTVEAKILRSGAVVTLSVVLGGR